MVDQHLAARGDGREDESNPDRLGASSGRTRVAQPCAANVYVLRLSVLLTGGSIELSLRWITSSNHIIIITINNIVFISIGRVMLGLNV